MTTETQTRQGYYTIPEANWATFVAEVDRINKRAKRLGLAPVTYTREHDHELWYLGTPNGRGTWVAAVDAADRLADGCTDRGGRMVVWLVTVTGTTPCYAGWQLVAVLEPLAVDDGPDLNLIQTIPGHTCPGHYRDRVGACDHCNTARRRKQTFVVKHVETKETKCVGRQCLGDFLGAYNNNPQTLAAWCECLASLDAVAGELGNEDFWGGGGWVPSSYTLADYLAASRAVIRVRGWCARWGKDEYGNPYKKRNPTAELAWYVMCPDALARVLKQLRDNRDAQELREIMESIEVTDADLVDADTARTWAQDIDPDTMTDNNYLTNINTIARSGRVTEKTAGYAASIVSSWLRALEKLEHAAKQAARGPLQHVGTPGQRDTYQVTCYRLRSTEGQYGSTGIHALETPAGDRLTWFASGSTDWLEEGGCYEVKATVKNHDDHKGTPQTVVNRVKVVKELTGEDWAGLVAATPARPPVKETQTDDDDKKPSSGPDQRQW